MRLLDFKRFKAKFCSHSCSTVKHDSCIIDFDFFTVLNVYKKHALCKG